MEYESLLINHIELKIRSAKSNQYLENIASILKTKLDPSYNDLSVFCCGSLGRGDAGSVSDMDVFIFSEKEEDEIKRLSEINLLHHLISVNESLNFPKFSNDGMFLKIHSFKEMRKSLGSPRDDHKNLFTTRMLMLLESKPLWNENLYNDQVGEIIEYYFRDGSGRSTFKPLFLLNDILRFWRTLCLNYEIVRNDSTKPFRKKNINLKFSRMLTIFSTVLPIISSNKCDEDYILALTKETPLKRLAMGLDNIGDLSLSEKYKKFLDCYEFFLVKKEELKETQEVERPVKEDINKKANEFSEFLFSTLNHESISREYKKYLVL